MTGDIGKKMYVIKRDGRHEEVSFDKVLHRIQTLAVGIDHVNPALVAQKVCNQIQDGIKTSELDEFAAETAAMMVGRAHPNYGKLAACIAIDNHHKNTPATFKECAELLYAQGVVSQKIWEVSRMVGIQEIIDYNRDFELFDYFGFKTLEKSYLQKIAGKVVERPQHMWMRVAVEIHTDEYTTEHFGYPTQYIPNMRRIAETYDALSRGYFIHATPTLFNAGTNHTQLSSCFVAGTLVHTMNGVKPIESVEIGDEVVTHTGHVKKVKQLHTNLLGDRTLFDIKMAGTPSITVTGNHRLWSISDEQEKWNQPPTWNRVDYLRTGDWVAIPNNKTASETYILDTKSILDTIDGDGDTIHYSYEFIDDKVYPTYHYTSHHETEVRNHTKKGEPFNRYWAFNNETMELMGIWYGDGSVTHAKNSSRNMVPRNINIVSHDTNTVLIEFVKAAFVNMLGVDHITVSKDQHHMVTIVVNNTIVAALFKKIFKCKFDGKRLPSFFNRLSYENIKYFIAGLVSSDGCVSKTNSITIQLTNPPLVNDIFYLARSVGIPLTVTFMGATETKKATGRMSVPGDLVNGHVKKYYEDDRLETMSDVSWKQFRSIDGTMFVRINNKTISAARPHFVYTFGVEDDHSYSVGGIVAENCFLLDFKADSIKGIYETLGDCAQISKWAGGIGLAAHKIRAKNSRIQGTNGVSTGIVPMLKVFNDTARYVNQGGKRNGSFAVYLEPWHADIEDFLRLKLNTGAEEDRARDLFYGLWIPDEFMRRVKEDRDWTLMCPHECPGLSDVHSEEFTVLYRKYEAEGKGRKAVPAQKLWQMILDAQIQTGTPYLCYKDAGNFKSNQKNLGTIKSSNLCSEIFEYTDAGETAVCNLGSISLTRFVKEDKTYDFDALRHYVAILARNLDIVIDRNYYPTPESRESNMRHRPIGIGVQGLADVLAKMRITWSSPEAADLNRRIFEHIYYAALHTSYNIAVDKGSYPSFEGSPASQGILQPDLWRVNPLSEDLDWQALRHRVKKGLRNSLSIALMPTASTSQILGNNECFEPFTSNLYVRHVLAGDFIVINKYLISELVELGVWSPELRTSIIANNGSVLGVQGVPPDVQERYRTAWEIPMKTIINLAADRAPFVCQSQSLNLFVADPSYARLSSMHIYAWEKGLKTGCYYLRTKAVASAQKFTVEPEARPQQPDCLTCSA